MTSIPRELPAELYDEITSLLWNDFPSLKACSLANRVLTAPSQKRLFHSLALGHPHLQRNNKSRVRTSSDFYNLLAASPHIAEYVKSLHILDFCSFSKLSSPSGFDDLPNVLGKESSLRYENYRLENGEEIPDLDSRPVTSCNDDSNSAFEYWLPRDKFLPLFAPLLSNLKALTLSYYGSWSLFTFRVLISILHLIQMPSLHHLRCNFPEEIALGENVKHLVWFARTTSNNERFPLKLEHPPSKLVYLDTLYMDTPFPILRLQSPTSRIQTSRIQKLVIIYHWHSETQGRDILLLLQCCRDTLVDLEFTLCRALFLKETILHEGPINLGMLTSLRRFAVSFGLIGQVHNENPDSVETPFEWLHHIFRSGYPTSGTHSLEEVSIEMWGAESKINILQLQEMVDMFLEKEFSTLKILNIFVYSFRDGGALKVVEMLHDYEGLKKLSCRVDLDVRVCNHPFRFEQDVRWETHDWTRWKHVDVHDDCS